jgi:TolA-binding protein
MNCQQLDRNELVEKYLNNQLDSAEQDEFEIHILECPACLHTVEMFQALSEGLSQQEHEIRVQRQLPRPWFRWKWLALASVVVFGGAGVLELRHLSAPPTHTASLPVSQGASSSPTFSDLHKGASSSAPVNLAAKPPSMGPPPAPGRHNTEAAKRNPTRDHNGRYTLGAPQQPGIKPPDVPSGLEANTASPQSASVAPKSDERASAPSVSSSTTPSVGNREHPAPPSGTGLATDEAARELFRLGVVQPPPYTFSGLAAGKGNKSSKPGAAPESGLGTAPDPAAGRSLDPGRTYFQNGMNAYVEKRYRDAIDLLERAVDDEPKAPDANFFLGVCRLLEARQSEAIPPLKTVAANEQSPYAQSAHFYLAKAYIQMGDLAQAETELEAAAAVPGRLGAEARSALSRLQAVRAEQGKGK